MLECKEITMDDREWINELLSKSDYMGCEYSFANNFAWRRLYNSKISRYKDFYISCSCNGKTPIFTFPAGEGDLEEVITVMRKTSEKMGCPLLLSSVSEHTVKQLEEIFPGQFSVDYNEDNFDYIYDTKEFIELSGKKYHGKRNHIKKFKQNDWSYEPITKENTDECIEFATIFYLNNNKYDDHSAVVEQFAINTFFTHFDSLGLKGGLLRCDGKIVGFSIGERLNSETFVVHIEKARSDIQGAYPTLSNEFALHEASEYKYLNREEDLGIEGLRRAKKSFYPIFLLKKATVKFDLLT